MAQLPTPTVFPILIYVLFVVGLGSSYAVTIALDPTTESVSMAWRFLRECSHSSAFVVDPEAMASQ